MSDHAALTDDDPQRVTENPQEFLMRTLSKDQWRVVADCLRIEVAEAVERERAARLALVAKIEALADNFDARGRRGAAFFGADVGDTIRLLSADDTKALD